MSLPCPCCSTKNFDECCEVFIRGDALPDTPEKLMRSRYSAYSQANVAYIAETMKSPASDGFDRKEAEKWAKKVEWLKLEVLRSETNDDTGWVEFVAHFSENDHKQKIHEVSEFRRDNGKWFYVDGSVNG